MLNALQCSFAIEPTRYFLYVIIGAINRKIQIRRVSGNIITIDYHHDFAAFKKMPCFIVAKDDRGIITFDADFSKAANQRSEKHEVIDVQILSGTEKLLNRREFVRIEPPRHTLKLSMLNNAGVQATLLNLSAGGALFATKDKLPLDSLLKLDLLLGTETNLHLNCGVRVCYVGEDDHGHNLASVFFLHDTKLLQLPVMTTTQETHLLQFINRLLLERRKPSKSK